MTGAQITACFDTHHVPYSTDSADLDFIASAAGDTGIDIEGPHQRIQIAVERSKDDANGTRKTYGLFQDAFDQGHVEQFGNVVVAYSKTPTTTEMSLIEECMP